MNVNKRTYVKRKDYLVLLKKIKLKCIDMGVDIKIYYRPIIWNRNMYGGPNFGELSGYYCVSKKKITAKFYGKIGYARRLELLLHELRHAIHHKEGLYSNYYKEEWENLEQLLLQENPILPCKKTALLAEMDCNRFAYYWLKKEGVAIPKDFKYKGTTMAESIHRSVELKQSKQSLKNIK